MPRRLVFASDRRATAVSSAMLSVIVVLGLIGVLALLMWNIGFTGFRRRVFDQATDVRQAPPNQAYGFSVAFSLFEDNPLGNGSGAASRVTKEERARAYLNRILALTGATQVDNAYVLNVGKVQFQLRDRFVRRLQNPKDPRAGFEETCFYLVHSGMPKAEEIATALLQLSNNPALFDKWALQNGVAFKADGRVFERAQ
jgi:hypothetical protein